MPRPPELVLSTLVRLLPALLVLAASCCPRAHAQPPSIVAQMPPIPKSPGFRMEVHSNNALEPELTMVNKARAAASAASAATSVPAKGRRLAGASSASAAASSAATAASSAASAPLDPIEHLRQRLAASLGATAPTGAGYTMQVSNRGESGENVVHTARAGARSGAAPRRRLQALPAASAASEPHGQPVLPPPPWDYVGPGAPEAWARLRPDYARCGTGQRQSPIDIHGGIAVDLEPIRFDYHPSGYAVTDTGHTVRVDVEPGNAITVMGRRYELQEFHFHRPAEERVDGREFAMDVQLVHRSADGHVAVIAVLLDPGAPQPAVQAVWNNLPLEKGDPLRAGNPLDPAQLLPGDRRYYTYMGSITTPPCDEGVLWMVMQQPGTVSVQQVDIFGHLYPMNARPVQQADGRLIKQSN